MWSTNNVFNFLNYTMAKITKKGEVQPKEVVIVPQTKEEQLEAMLARLEGNHVEKQAVRAIFQSLFRD